MMALNRPLTEDEQFFYEHAGIAYNPETETMEEGRIRGAVESASAEQYARRNHWEVRWEDDWVVGSHTEEYSEEAYPQEPDSCETATLYAPCEWELCDGHPLASLGCIDDATREYRRVIAAELASEALGRKDLDEWVNDCPVRQANIDRLSKGYTLNDIMEIDHVVQVHPDGTVTDAPPDAPMAPELYDAQLSGKGWSLMSYGYTGQYGYKGPVMHDSEYIGGRLARDILSEPGLYVAIVDRRSDDGDMDSEEGWAVAYRPTP